MTLKKSHRKEFNERTILTEGSGAMSREQDREMLEKAAKAAGYEFEWYCRGANNPNGVPNVPFANGHEWRPLDSDADAFRLMVDCGIEVVPAARQVTAIAPSKNGRIVASQEDYADKHAATRRAIVRAAAAMSEGQEG